VNRRSFLGWGLATGALVTLGGVGGYFYRRPQVAMLSAASSGGNHYGVLLDALGNIIQQAPLPSRAHAATFNTRTQQALFFCRRPGAQLFIVEPERGLTSTVNSGVGRHFYGHGILTADQRYLLATENDYESGEGVISIRDAERGYQLIEEIPSFGIGPHELAFVDAATDTLIVANGGLRTHPQHSRVPINLDTMQPNVTFIDWQKGSALSQWQPPMHQLSLRHLTVHEGTAIIGAQYQGAKMDSVPLVFSAGENSPLVSYRANGKFSAEHNQYTASVCAVNSDSVLISCPKANRVTHWYQQQLIESVAVRDVAGVAKHKVSNAIYYSSGDGSIGRVEMADRTLNFSPLFTHKGLRWDNHLVTV